MYQPLKDATRLRSQSANSQPPREVSPFRHASPFAPKQDALSSVTPAPKTISPAEAMLDYDVPDPTHLRSRDDAKHHDSLKILRPPRVYEPLILLRDRDADADCFWNESQQRYIYLDGELTSVAARHHDFTRYHHDPYQRVNAIGRGGTGTVDSVKSRQGDQRIFARKTIFVPQQAQKRQAAVTQMAKEAHIASRLRHHAHIVKVVETFETRTYFGIVMAPLATFDLGRLLDMLDEDSTTSHVPELRAMWLPRLPGICACLVATIYHIHSLDVRHKDIKPSNILLLEDGQVFLTDFGSARDFLEHEGLTTTGTSFGYTKEYAPPEAYDAAAMRGKGVDLFSLGCVLLEIALVYYEPGEARESFRERRVKAINDNERADYSLCPEVIVRQLLLLWMNYWREGGSMNATLEGILHMTHPLSSSRLDHEQLAALYFWYTGIRPCSACKSMVLPAVINSPRPPERKTKIIFEELAEGLAKCGSNGTISSENILRLLHWTSFEKREAPSTSLYLDSSLVKPSLNEPQRQQSTV